MSALQEKSIESISQPLSGDKSSNEEEDAFLIDLREKAEKLDKGELLSGVKHDNFNYEELEGLLDIVSVSKDEKPVVVPQTATKRTLKPRRRKFEKSVSQTQKSSVQKGKFPTRKSTTAVYTKPKNTQKRFPVSEEEQYFSFNVFINVKRNTQEAIIAMIHRQTIVKKVCENFGLEEEMVFHINTILPPNPDPSKFAIIHNISFRYMWSKCLYQLRDFIRTLNVRGGKKMIEFSGFLNGENISVEVPIQKCLQKYQRTPHTEDSIKVSNVPLFRLSLTQERVFKTSNDVEKFIRLPPSTICFYTSYKVQFSKQDFIYFIIRPSKLSDEDIAPVVANLQQIMPTRHAVLPDLQKRWIDVLLGH